jgi:hypothetical protein
MLLAGAAAYLLAYVIHGSGSPPEGEAGVRLT